MKCNLCGYDFEEKECAMACHGCPLSKGCRIIRCPNCGYDEPAESKLVSFLRNWRKKKSESK